jgi:hypothetical protein
MKKILSIFVGVVLLTSCTNNQRAKAFGGTANVDLPIGEKLIEVTWKEDNIWYLTRPMRENETPETYNFVEESSWGMVEGNVIIHEKK